MLSSLDLFIEIFLYFKLRLMKKGYKLSNMVI